MNAVFIGIVFVAYLVGGYHQWSWAGSVTACPRWPPASTIQNPAV
jgi:hypothetical protein